MKRSRRWPRVYRADTARWPRGSAGRELLRRLNRAGRIAHTRVVITSGRRTAFEQWVAYMDYLRGGILAAPCCGQAWVHQWGSCWQQCASNHCVSRAADCEVQRPDGMWVNAGEYPRFRRAMKRAGLCLPVGSGETWHVEVGDTWRS